MEDKYLFTIENLTKKYMQGEKEIKALDNVNLNVKAGEDIAIIGPSAFLTFIVVSIFISLKILVAGLILKRQTLEIVKSVWLYKIMHF